MEVLIYGGRYAVDLMVCSLGQIVAHDPEEDIRPRDGGCMSLTWWEGKYILLCYSACDGAQPCDQVNLGLV